MSGRRFERLTARECEVVTLLAQGLSAKEVAAELAISPGTVEKHVEMVMVKLRARNRVQMALLAVADGLVDIGICRNRLSDDKREPGEFVSPPARVRQSG